MNNECTLQLDLLRRIFYLSDLHSANFGLNGDNKLFIVDFQVFFNLFPLSFFLSHSKNIWFIFQRTSLKSTHFKSLTYQLFIQVDHHTKSVNVHEYLRGDKQDCIKVGKASFEHWNLGQMVAEADTRISHQKQLFRDRGVTFQPSKDYGKYLVQIKENISAFAVSFAQE